MSDKAGSLVDQQEENKLISGYRSQTHNENTSWKEALLVEPLPTTCFLTLFPSWSQLKLLVVLIESNTLTLAAILDGRR